MRWYGFIIVVGLTMVGGSVDPATFRIDSDSDSHDVVPGDGYARDAAGPESSHCTLRAAIEESNALIGPDTILIPAALGTIRLNLGSLYVRDGGTLIAGENGRPTIDGVGNATNQATLIIISDSNMVRSLAIRRSRGDAIVVFGGGNEIGGPGAGEGLILTANGLDNTSSFAVRITGPDAIGNTVVGCYIGLESDGFAAEGNVNGVALEYHAHNNRIGGFSAAERNIISGNTGCGIVISGRATLNRVAGNFVGPDLSGNSGPGNGLDGIAVLGEADGNFIGADSLPQGNVISGNRGNGIVLSGAWVTQNRIDGNLVGTDPTGYAELGNRGDGVLVTEGAHDNQIGGTQGYSGNLISGNGGHGLRLSGAGTSSNVVTANWIGISRDGYGYVGNGWLIEGDGVSIEAGASSNTIGGPSATLRNVISANYRFGVSLVGSGTKENDVIGNYIGLNFAGTSSLGNAAGVAMMDGAERNRIGGLTAEYGNVISGNRSDEFPYSCGVLIWGSDTRFNSVSANLIGLDATGLKAKRNGSCGVIIGSGAQFNLIGGNNLTDGNVISGNGVGDPIDGLAAGIHIAGASTAYNRIEGNLIGPDKDNQGIVGNRGHGIGIYAGAHHNIIGGGSFREANIIEGNEGAAVLVSGSQSRSNLIRRNMMEHNDGLGIDLRDTAQGGIYPPRITYVGMLYNYGMRLVAGRNAPPGVRIDIYQVGEPDPSGAGEGYYYLANTVADVNGRFEFYMPPGPPIPIILTAVSVDADSNTSAFSVNGYSPDATPVEDPDVIRPAEFALSQNYPNPFNAGTVIEFSLPERSRVSLRVYNVLGQSVCTLAERSFPAGLHSVTWDGRNESGEDAASGAYFYRLESSAGTVTRKMLLLK